MKISNFIDKFILKRKILVITLMKLYCANIILKAKVLLVGASSKSKLVGFKFYKDVNCIFTDIDTSNEEIVYLDIEKKFDLTQKSFDFIVCLNVLEHIKNFDIFFKEQNSTPLGIFAIYNTILNHN